MKLHEVICAKSATFGLDGTSFSQSHQLRSSNSTTGSPFVPNNMAIRNETVEMIKNDLKSKSEGRYIISPQDFSEIEIPLCESRSR